MHPAAKLMFPNDCEVANGIRRTKRGKRKRRR
jgi:hypothetical protein